MFPANPNNLSIRSSQAYQVGDEIEVHWAGGPLRTYPETGDVWLRAGNQVPAVDYPKAAQAEHLKISGIGAALPSAITVTQMAHDGAGKIVAAYGDATNVMVSTDGGATWAAVAHNAGGAVCAVAYGLGVWVCAGNSAATTYVSSSTDAATFTVRTGTAITTGTAASAWLAFDGSTTFLIAVAGATAGGAHTSTNGTSWAARTTSQVVDTLARAAYANSLWAICGTGSTAACSSPDGTTWTNRTVPTAPTYIAGGNGIFVLSINASNQYTTTTNFVSFVNRPCPCARPDGAAANNMPNVTWTGAYFLAADSAAATTSSMLFSKDGITWNRRAVGLTATPIFFGAGSYITAVSTGSATKVAYSTVFPAADYVGTFYDGVTATGSTKVIAYKIKSGANT